MVTRSATHVIDTRAVRTVIKDLPDSWLVRGLEERDYGIDLMLEIFDGRYPTGHLVLAQIKGRNSDFGDPVKLTAFPVRTLLYAELFVQPFFAFYSSLTTNTTYFVWLQKYIQAKLDHESPGWRNQKSVTIEFPADNILGSNAKRVVEITKLQSLRDVGVSFLAEYEWLRMHAKAVRGGEIAVAKACLANLTEIKKFTEFLDEFGQTVFELDLLQLADSFESVLLSGTVDAHAESVIEHQVSQLGLVKMAFLGRVDIDRLAVEMSSAYPY